MAYFTRVTGLHPPTAFLFSQFTAANLASAVLPPSNPTNLVLTSTTSTSFLTYALYLILPVFFSSIALLGVLFIQFSPYNKLLNRNDNEVYIPAHLNAPEVNPRSVLIDKSGAIFSSVILTITLILLVVCSVFIEGIHVCWITIPAAFVVFVRDLIHDWRHHANFKSKIDEKSIGLLRIVKLSFPTVLSVGSRLPFALVPFAITQFILVNSLQAVGWIDIFAGWAETAIRDQALRAVWILGLIEIVLCNGSTNIGATVLMSQVLVNSTSDPKTIRAGMLGIAFGSNIGAFSFTFSASLAGLLWDKILGSKGIKIPRLQFLLMNICPLIVTALIGFFVIYAEVIIME